MFVSARRMGEVSEGQKTAEGARERAKEVRRERLASARGERCALSARTLTEVGTDDGKPKKSEEMPLQSPQEVLGS